MTIRPTFIDVWNGEYYKKCSGHQGNCVLCIDNKKTYRQLGPSKGGWIPQFWTVKNKDVFINHTNSDHVPMHATCVARALKADDQKRCPLCRVELADKIVTPKKATEQSAQRLVEVLTTKQADREKALKRKQACGLFTTTLSVAAYVFCRK